MKMSKMMMTAGLLAGALVSAPGDGLAGSSPEDEVRAAVRAYVAGADAQDTAAVEKTVHPAFRVVASMGGTGEISLMSKADYLKLLDAKKIGGAKRKVTMEWTKQKGNIAFVKAVLDSDAARFDALYTVVRHEGRWVVVEDAVRFDGK